MTTTLTNHWIDLAATHGSTKWLKQFIRTYLPQLQEGAIAPVAFEQALAGELESRNLVSAAQQKNYRSNLVQALKVIDDHHPAIALVTPTTEQYRQLNETQRGKLAERQTKFITSTQAEELVQRAAHLLESSEWSEVAAGLAVLIGRRISEILLSQFELHSPWSLTFKEMAKKPDAQKLTIEIPTLAPARQVIAAILKLQRSLHMDDLKLTSLSPKMAKQTVNAHFSGAVAARCDQHFADLVPARHDKDNLYTHVFRAVYATIAAHWFCPPSVPEHAFKAEIQGHFTLTHDSKKSPNYSARANYDDYAIGTDDGNRNGRLGIKLAQLPNLTILAAFTPQQPPNNNLQLEVFSMLQQVDKDKNDKDRTVDDSIDKDGNDKDRTMDDSDTDTRKSRKAKPELSPPEPNQDLISADQLTQIAQALQLLLATSLSTPPDSQPAPPPAKKTRRAKSVPHSPSSQPQAQPSSAQPDSVPAHSLPLQALSNLAPTLNWFVYEITTLRTQLAHLQVEHENLLQAQTASPQIDHLQAENTQLHQQIQDQHQHLAQLQSKNAQIQQQLHQTQTRLNAIQHLLAEQINPTHPAPSTPDQPVEAISTNATPPTHPQFAPTPSSTAPQPKSAPKRSKRLDTDLKIHQIIDALLSWNSAQDDNQHQLRISIPIIKAFASPMGANYQPAIQQVIKERELELESHHSRFLLGTRHNASVLRKDQILKQIAQNYLALDNWKQTSSSAQNQTETFP